MHPDEKKLFKRIGILVVIVLVIVPFFYLRSLGTAVDIDAPVDITIAPGESVAALSARLEEEGIIKSASLFRRYLAFKGIDTNIQVGTFQVDAPITMRRVASALLVDTREEREITVLPGWTIREIAAYLEIEEYGSQQEVFTLLGQPAQDYRPGTFRSSIDADLQILLDKPNHVSFEGYLAPETYRVFADATVQDIVNKLLLHRESQLTDKMYRDIEKSGRTFFEVLTVASIVEREVRGKEDKKIVADLFWRRYDENWALQADSTVHYIHGDADSVFTSAAQREVDNPWNTYKYPGLPLGPISSPSIETIEATIYPKKNSYAYFLTDLDGNVHYAETLEGHNANRARYLQ